MHLNRIFWFNFHYRRFRYCARHSTTKIMLLLTNYCVLFIAFSLIMLFCYFLQSTWIKLILYTWRFCCFLYIFLSFLPSNMRLSVKQVEKNCIKIQVHTYKQHMRQYGKENRQKKHNSIRMANSTATVSESWIKIVLSIEKDGCQLPSR